MYATLLDFDWSLRLALSSDKVSGLRSGRVLLKLNVEKVGGMMSEEAVVELDHDELASLLQRLKDAQAAVQGLKK